MTIKVIEHPLSPYAQKVKLALHFKGLEFEAETPVIGVGDEDFSSVSPRAEVPVLVHDGITLYQSSVIGAYIDETWPEPNMMPHDPLARANVRLIEDALDTHFEGHTWGLGEIRIFGRAEGEKADLMCAFAEKEIRGWYRWLETRLSTDHWLNGDQYGWADICAVPFISGAGRFDIWPHEGSGLGDWLTRINERPDVAEVTAAARAAELDPGMMQAAIHAGFKREYRDHRLEWMIRAGGLDIVSTGIEAGNVRFNQPFV